MPKKGSNAYTYLCCNCKHWERCFHARYNGERKKYMEEIEKSRDSYGKMVIYVTKCTKYKFEQQKYPKNNLCKPYFWL